MPAVMCRYVKKNNFFEPYALETSHDLNLVEKINFGLGQFSLNKNHFDKFLQDKTSLNRIQKNTSLFTSFKYFDFWETAHHGLSRLKSMPSFSAHKFDLGRCQP
jgi:hypothetical protein